MAACPACAAELTGTPRFCSECGTRLDARPPRAVRKDVSVLFADLAGSTALGEQLDPESLRALLTRYFAELKAICVRHGGTVEKFIGDAVMAVFGIPVAHEDDAERAVRAAAEIRDRVAALSAELEGSRAITLRVRVGVNTGSVVAGDPADGGTLVTGDAVNTAARLEQAAAPGEVLVGERTMRLVRDAVRAEALAPIEARGKSLPVPAFRILGVTRGAPGHARRFGSPLVGRERELARLRGAWEDATAQRRPHLFTLLGAAGVGKSRLVLEFTRSLPAGSRVLAGTCLSYGDGITWWPLREVVSAAAGIEEGDDGAAARGKLEAVLTGERDAGVIASRLAGAIGLSEELVATEEVPWAARRFLQAVARQAPLVVVWDDLQWAEPAFLDLVEHLADLARDVPLLLLCMARPDLLDGRSGWGGGKLAATTVLLEPLPPEASDRLIDNLPGGGSLPAALRARIADAAEGNPLFVEEMLAMLVDEGHVLRGDDGSWETRDGLDAVPVPLTIRALLTARLDRLPVEERALAERASVVGRVFERTAVVQLSPEPERAGVTTSLLSLVRKELVRAEDEPGLGGDEAYAFRHLLIRDAAYEALPKAERATLHERFAGWLEEAAGDRLAEYEEIVGHHLAEALRYRRELGLEDEHDDELRSRTADRLVGAGRRAFYRGDSRAAAALYERATDVASLSHPAIRRDLHFYGIAVTNARGDADARALYEEARRLAEETGDRLLDLRARLMNIELTIFLRPPSERAAELVPVVEALVALEDHWGAARGWGLVADIESTSGWITESGSTAERAFEHAVRSGDPRETARQAHAVIVSLANGPAPTSRAVPRAREVVAQSVVSRPFEALCRATLGAILGMAGDADAARNEVRRATEIANTIADAGIPGLTSTFEAWTETNLGDDRAAIAPLRRWLSVAGVTHGPSVERGVKAGLAELLVRTGELDEARRLLVEAADGPMVGVMDDALLRRAQARLAAEDGRFDDAQALLAQGRAFIEGTNLLSERAEMEWTAAHVALRAGDADAARDRAEVALDLFRAKEHVPGTQRAVAFLASLRA